MLGEGAAIQKWMPTPSPQSALCLSRLSLSSPCHGALYPVSCYMASAAPCPPFSRCQCKELL